MHYSNSNVLPRFLSHTLVPMCGGKGLGFNISSLNIIKTSHLTIDPTFDFFITVVKSISNQKMLKPRNYQDSPGVFECLGSFWMSWESLEFQKCELLSCRIGDDEL
jgi:hypothetical protein